MGVLFGSSLLSALAVAQTPKAFCQAKLTPESGTLRTRFRDTPVQGRLYGKTGVLSGAVALSGYLELPNADQLAISILVNQTEQSLEEVQAAIDAIIQLLTQMGSC